MGAGRSGTTLLDILLGNGDGFVSCGELNRFPRHQGHPPLVDLDPVGRGQVEQLLALLRLPRRP